MAIRQQLDLPITRIENTIKEHNIDYRPKTWYMPDEIYYKLIDKEWCMRAREKYGNEGIYGICRGEFNNEIGPDTIRYHFQCHGIDTSPIPITELFPVLNDKETLELMYESMSLVDMADEIGASHPVVKQAFD